MEDGQWQELCEWAGWEWSSHMGPCKVISYNTPDGEVLMQLPPQDMNILFEWMWPKLTVSQRLKVFNLCEGVFIYGDKNYFDTLADTIYKVVKDERI